MHDRCWLGMVYGGALQLVFDSRVSATVPKRVLAHESNTSSRYRSLSWSTSTLEYSIGFRRNNRAKSKSTSESIMHKSFSFCHDPTKLARAERAGMHYPMYLSR